jgi:hypothetical protein
MRWSLITLITCTITDPAVAAGWAQVPGRSGLADRLSRRCRIARGSAPLNWSLQCRWRSRR